MEKTEKTINERRYRFAPMPAGPDGLEVYSDVMAALVPSLLAFGESGAAALLSKDLRDQFAGFADKPTETRAALLGMVGDIVQEAATQGVFSRLGRELGTLLGNRSFRALVVRLMSNRLEIEAVSPNPTTGETTMIWQPVAHVEHHFSAHLEDWIPAAAWALWTNYRRAFSAPLGLLPTQVKDAMGAVQTH